jgi:hypothetical protein
MVLVALAATSRHQASVWIGGLPRRWSLAIKDFGLSAFW